MSDLVIDLTAVSKIYGTGDAVVVALESIDLQIGSGEYVAIMGSSGSGKSTLMNIIGCLDEATTGRYLLGGHDVSRLDQDTLALVRNKMIGFVFQSFHLIPRMTAQANVELPMIYGGKSISDRRRIATELLDLVGLSDRNGHHPNALSGGQQQRVAIARALTMSPSLLLADEPTGNLDSTASHEVMGLLDDLNREGRTIVLITHEEDVAAHAQRVIRIVDGRVIEDTAVAVAS
ncbi:MAG: putative transporter ATP-binding protein [Nocardioidaceae bacterium]|nr:putative transporter ATP-binding protein [Nocardioidaceae bacterium]